MVLSKPLITAAALLAATTGCKQSLFDSNVGDDDDDILQFDAAGPSVDADPNAPDADPNAPDANPDQPDANYDGPPCPDTCRADAARDFDGSLGGSNGAWRYVSDHRDRTWTQMAIGQYMSLDAMVGSGDPAPAVLSCRDYPSESICAGNTHRLLLIPSDAGGSNADPALEYKVTATGAFTLSGEFLAQAAAGNHTIKIYRNTRDDLLYEQLFPTDTTVRTFSVDVEAATNDVLTFTVEPATAGMAVPVGVHLFVTETVGAFPRGCSLTARFEEVTGPDFVEDCGLVTYDMRDYNDGSPIAADGTLVDSVIPRLGTAARIPADHYIRPMGSTMDYTGSFTIDLWVQVSGFPSFFGTMYADWHNIPDGGVNFGVSDSWTFGISVLHDVDDETGLSFSYPDDGGWHHVRIVRDADKNRLRACVDGQLRGNTFLSGLLDLTTDQGPFLGRNVVYNPPYFDGAVDDVRVFSRAYPCGPP